MHFLSMLSFLFAFLAIVACSHPIEQQCTENCSDSTDNFVPANADSANYLDNCMYSSQAEPTQTKGQVVIVVQTTVFVYAGNNAMTTTATASPTGINPSISRNNCNYGSIASQVGTVSLLGINPANPDAIADNNAPTQNPTETQLFVPTGQSSLQGTTLNRSSPIFTENNADFERPFDTSQSKSSSSSSGSSTLSSSSSSSSAASSSPIPSSLLSTIHVLMFATVAIFLF
ncbi:hypothetical protein AYI70_g6823 [Smittium culicis]|uniref:Uncharacterized protein n=1 Tax=Smittium culicis TaxID=133412 RepID=A0A1R1XN88_9FUNG|nr:hypothetical protein AYI70_g6823 [Smittium culicis]